MEDYVRRPTLCEKYIHGIGISRISRVQYEHFTDEKGGCESRFEQPVSE